MTVVIPHSVCRVRTCVCVTVNERKRERERVKIMLMCVMCKLHMRRCMCVELLSVTRLCKHVCVLRRRVYVYEPVFVRVDLVSTCSLCQRPVTLTIPHSACPPVYVGKSSYYDTNQNKTIEYDSFQHNPASCGNATECPAAISSITDTVFSAMKTGFAVRV